MNISERFIANAGATVEVLDDQTFNSSGTWTKPTGIQFAPTDMALVEMWGGGQGGGRISGSNIYAVGGFGGDYVRFVVPVSDLANTQSVVVGAGGAGSSSTAGAPGSSGGDSRFAGRTALGGFLGGFTDVSSARLHALSAVCYTSRVYSAGAGGSVVAGNALYPPVPSAVGGSGGAASTSTNGAGGQAPGGGGGASAGSTGGAGAKGQVRVRIMRGLNQFEIAEGPL